MFKKIFWLILLLPFISFQPEIAFSSQYKFQGDEAKKWPVAVVGDLQKTSVWEFMLVREQNDPERIKIINQIKNEKPESAVILGDMIFDGSSRKSWNEFDLLLKPIAEKGINIIPVVGNHEYWGNNATALINLYKRFPAIAESHWYSVVNDSIAFIILDSNDDDLSFNAWEKEKNWFNNILKSYDADPAVKGIIVFTHHPPFTNSIVTGDEINVQKAFLPAFFKANKTLAFLSGHAHTYERFLMDGKTFIVSGGGGGPRVKLKAGKDCHEDFCTRPSPRPFNFLLLNKESNGVKVTVKGLEKGGADFFILDEFVLPYPDIFSFK